MKKNQAFWKTALLSGLFLAASTVSFAEPVRLPSREWRRPVIPRFLPDLAVEDIRVNNDCQVVVKIRNNGPGRLFDDVWNVHTPKSAGIYLSINGQKWGGATIWGFDPTRALQASGGTAEYTSNLKVSAHSVIRAEIDLWNVVPETNKANNVLTKTLSCGEVPPVTEDCITFNPNTTEVKEIGGRWKIVDGNHWMFDFGSNKAEAEKAFNIIRYYRMNSTCFVGRPDPSFTYLLVSGNAPEGAFVGEDSIPFNPATIEVKEIGGRWKIVDGSQWMFDFGSNKVEAETAFAIIKKYGFRYSCFVGRPNPSFIYMRK
jgi:hypothetical protein